MPQQYTYYSSTDCTIYISPADSHVRVEAREIFALQVGEQEQILPVYGWNDTYFHTIGSGNILVSGTLIFNARYPNYIESLINGHPIVPTDKLTANQTALEGIRTKIDDMISSSDTNGSPYDTKIVGALVDLARYNDEFNSPEVDETTYNTINLSRKTGFNIIIEGPYSKDVIADCRLSSRATEVNAGESNNIKSAQSFIGRMLTQTKK